MARRHNAHDTMMNAHLNKEKEYVASSKRCMAPTQSRRTRSRARQGAAYLRIHAVQGANHLQICPLNGLQPQRRL